MDYLSFDLVEGTDGVSTLEAMASTRADAHAAVMAEVRRVLDWAWQQFPDRHGAIEDGMAWDHELVEREEDGGWHTVTLTLTGDADFVHAFGEAFGTPGS